MRNLLKSLFCLMLLALSVGTAFGQDGSSVNDGMFVSFGLTALNFLVEKVGVAGTVVLALISLIGAGRAYIASTPDKSDDQWLQKIEAKPYIGIALRILAAFSPKPRK